MSIHCSRIARFVGTAVCSLLLGLAGSAGGADRQIPSNPKEVPKSDQVLSIATYNVKLMPDVADVAKKDKEWSKTKERRALLIPRALEGLGDFDAVIFTEAFHDKSRAVLLREMRIRGFRYNTCILGSAYKDAKDRKKDTVYGQRRAMGPSLYRKVKQKWVETNKVELKRKDFEQAGEGDMGLNQDGGVFIVSRHPLFKPRELVFTVFGLLSG